MKLRIPVHDGVFCIYAERHAGVFYVELPVCKTLVAFSGFFLYNYKYATKTSERVGIYGRRQTK